MENLCGLTEQGKLYERLEALDRSPGGHLSTITRLCNELDEDMNDFCNIVKIYLSEIP